MRHLRCAKSFLVLCLASAGLASAQITITNVSNAGSRLPASSTSSGIAQGALFVVAARGIGPADIQQASFPLPTTDGLAGVTIQVSVGGATLDAIMVYVAPDEVAAILPSLTPIGTGTIKVTSNGVSATAPIKVVAAAFGIFTQLQGHVGTAVAFNVSADDGSAAPNSNAQSAQPGQDVLINGTGLGAITSDETQSGVIDVPASAIKVYVGIKPATVVSAGRGVCCDGLDPAYRIPQGIAAWDVIRFTIPDGVAGCFIPVVVQIGNSVSNLATISVVAGGGACAPAVSTFPPELTLRLAGQTGVSIGTLGFGRSDGVAEGAQGRISMSKGDTGRAGFSRINNVPASLFAADYFYSENVCQINGFPGPNGGAVVNGMEAPIVPLTSVPLDAGPTISVIGPSGTRTITRQTVGTSVVYMAPEFGNATPGNYYDPGHYTVTGTGGKDVGAFSTSFDVPPAPFVWTNMPSVTAPIDRSKDLMITWTGGIPGTQVTIEGGTLVNGVAAGFLCAAPVSAGQITVPSYVLLNVSPNPAPAMGGQLTLLNAKVTTFTASGLDIGSVRHSGTHTLQGLRFQ